MKTIKRSDYRLKFIFSTVILVFIGAFLKQILLENLLNKTSSLKKPEENIKKNEKKISYCSAGIRQILY